MCPYPSTLLLCDQPTHVQLPQDHQRADWSAHKPECATFRRLGLKALFYNDEEMLEKWVWCQDADNCCAWLLGVVSNASDMTGVLRTGALRTLVGAACV